MKKLKTALLIASTFLITAFTILSDLMQAHFSTEVFEDPFYWVNLISSQSAFIVLILMERTLAKDKERKENEMYKFRWGALSDAYLYINDNDLFTSLDDYIRDDNYARKLKKYRQHLGKRVTFWRDRAKKHEILVRRAEIAAKDRGEAARGRLYEWHKQMQHKYEARRDFWQDKLDRSAEEAEYVRFHYIRYSQSLLFNEVEERVRDADDPAAHEARHVGFLLATKGVMIFAFGVITASYFTFDFTLSWVAAYRAVIKILQTVWSLYVGMVAGQSFIRDTMCAKLMIRYNYVKQFMERRRLGFRISELTQRMLDEDRQQRAEAAAPAEGQEQPAEAPQGKAEGQTAPPQEPPFNGPEIEPVPGIDDVGEIYVSGKGRKYAL